MIQIGIQQQKSVATILVIFRCIFIAFLSAFDSEIAECRFVVILFERKLERRTLQLNFDIFVTLLIVLQ